MLTSTKASSVSRVTYAHFARETVKMYKLKVTSLVVTFTNASIVFFTLSRIGNYAPYRQLKARLPYESTLALFIYLKLQAATSCDDVL